MKYNLSGPQYLTGSGYLVTYCPEHPKAWASGKVRVHIAVAYEKYGDIPDGYVVHHLDLNKLNNDPSNLIILPEMQHKELHRYLDKHPECIGMSEEDTMKLFTEKHISELIREDIPENELGQLELEKQRLEKKLKSPFFTNDEKAVLKKDLEDTKTKIRNIRAINNKKPHPKEKLIEILEEEHNILAASKRFGVSYQTFRAWCHKEHIDLDPYVFEPSRHSKVLTKVCPVCGKSFTCTERDEKTYCSRECADNRFVHILTKEVLINCYRDGMSMSAIGKKYNTTKNTVLKYSKRYGLK